MTQKPNYTAQLSGKESLREIAARLGCIQTRGKGKEQGSIRKMLENISQGDIVIMFHDYDHPYQMVEAADEIRKIASHFGDYTRNTLQALANALESAAKYKE